MSDSNRHFRDEKDRPSRRDFLAKGIQSCSVGTVAAWGCMSRNGMAEEDDRRPKLPSWSHSVEDLVNADYQRNTARFGGRLASPIEELLENRPSSSPWQYEVLIVGSGISASVCATRLASKLIPGKKIAVLEKGREWIPGARSRPTSLPLHSVQRFDTLTSIQANGLGGSSLIHPIAASVPSWETMMQAAWPEALRSRLVLANYYDHLVSQLGLKKTSALVHDPQVQNDLQQRLGASDLQYGQSTTTVARRTGSSQLPVLNSQGWLNRPCTDCGECFAGCNQGAMNGMNCSFLPMAKGYGVSLFTQTTVHSVEKLVDHYRVHFTHHSIGENGTMHSTPGCTTAKIIILAAGSIASTEILLRSQGPHLRLSQQLGANWNDNGMVAASISRKHRASPPSDEAATSMALPWIGEVTDRTWQDRLQVHRGLREQDLFTALGLPVSSSNAVWLALGHNPARGRLELKEDGSMVLRWQAGERSFYQQRARAELRRWATALHYHAEFPDEYATLRLHSLGGCSMSDEPLQGVVNHQGQVFDTSFGGDIDPITGTYRTHPGLYVVGSATIPTTLGCSPFFTIAALSDRASELLTLDPQFSDLFTL